MRLTGGCLPRKFEPPANICELAGSFVYVAPNVLAGQGYSSTSDVYAIGLFIYELLLNTLSFQDQRRRKFTEFKRDVDPIPMFADEAQLEFLSNDTCKLIKSCLDLSSSDFPTANYLLESIGTIQQEKVIQPGNGQRRSVHDKPRTLK